LEKRVQAPPHGISLQAAHRGERPQFVIAPREYVKGRTRPMRVVSRHAHSPDLRWIARKGWIAYKIVAERLTG
jgi:hypothetical protein